VTLDTLRLAFVPALLAFALVLVAVSFRSRR
jgi:hypothetical protein